MDKGVRERRREEEQRSEIMKNAKGRGKKIRTNGLNQKKYQEGYLIL